MAAEPCTRCGWPTAATFGALPLCFTCLRVTQDEIRARQRRDPAPPLEPAYAPGLLCCDRCGKVVREGGPEDFFEKGRHGAAYMRGHPDWPCNGMLRRLTVAEARRKMAEGGDAA